MRAFRHLLVAAFFVASGSSSFVSASTMYSSQTLASGTDRKYIQVNNHALVLTMRQESPALADLKIVVEDWTPGHYVEFRPGTLPGTTRSIATAFNDAQQIVGYAETADAGGNIYGSNGAPLIPPRAFVYNGAFVDLSVLPPLNSATRGSFAQGINSQGDVVGYWWDDVGRHAFLYSHGTIADLGMLDTAVTAPNTQAAAINDGGQIAGSSTLARSSTENRPNEFSRAVSYRQATMTNIHSLAQWESSVSVSINTAGEIVGNLHSGNHDNGCFIYSGGTMRDMGMLGQAANPYCVVSQINAQGVAVGVSAATPRPPDFATTAPFVYANGALTDLNTLIASTDPLVRDHVVLKNALSINERGQILATTVAVNSGPGGTYYLLTPVETGTTTPVPPTPPSTPTSPTPVPTSPTPTAPAPISPPPTSIPPSTAAPPTTQATAPDPSATATAPPVSNGGMSGGGSIGWLLLTLLSGVAVVKRK